MYNYILQIMTDYGMVDDDMIRKKFEITENVFFDKNDMNSYNRSLLSDWSPDPVSLESDRAVKNKFSGTKLNLFHSGIRQDNVPFHPDLCLELTDLDPRGAAENHDNSKFKEQSWRRRNDHVFKPDADNSVISGVISQEAIRSKKSELFRKSVKRFNEFETSMDGWTNGFNAMVPLNSNVENVEVTDKWTNELVDLNDTSNANRRDYTTSLSNLLPVGYNSTVDHKFTIAQYGQKYKLADQNNINVNKARHDITADQKKTDTKSGFVVSPIQLLVSQIQDRKKTSVNEQDTKYKDATLAKSYQTNKTTTIDNNLEKLYSTQTQTTAKMIDAFTVNYNKQFNKNAKLNMNQVDAITEKFISNNTDILSKMYTTKDKTEMQNILRNIITAHNQNNKTSDNIATIYNTSKQESKQLEKDKFIVDFNSIQRQNNDSTHNNMYSSKTPETFESYNYAEGGIDYNLLNMIGTDTNTQYRNNSDILFNATSVHGKSDLDNQFQDTHYLNRKVRVMGSKYTNNLIDYEDSLNQIDDISNTRMR